VFLPRLSCDDDYFDKLGRSTFLCVLLRVIKGWHVHKEMTLNYSVIPGKIKFVLFESFESFTDKVP